jgi:DNA-directed RNA polymerase subunit RPC12/RpoP
MIGLTCSKCGRRFTPTTQELETYLAESEGKKRAQVLCPHCGYHNKVDIHRLQQLMRFTPIGAKPEKETPPASEQNSPEVGA